MAENGNGVFARTDGISACTDVFTIAGMACYITETRHADIACYGVEFCKYRILRVVAVNVDILNLVRRGEGG